MAEEKLADYVAVSDSGSALAHLLQFLSQSAGVGDFRFEDSQGCSGTVDADAEVMDGLFRWGFGAAVHFSDD